MPNHEGDQGGRPTAVIEYDKLKSMCQILCTGEECASILGMDYDTLNKGLARDGHGGFTDYLKKHGSEGKASLRRKQFKSAVEDGNVTMQIWLGKQILDQRDKKDVAMSHDLSESSLEELKAELASIDA
tara:strand:- start:175 stop:561 length:387 start_codon:yes stop_codon:yes gene_type:complete